MKSYLRLLIVALISFFAVALPAQAAAPVNIVPGAQTVNEDTALTFTGPFGQTISVSDADSNLATTRVTVAQGTLTVSVTGGATISAGANGTATLTLAGTQIQINAALLTLSYQGALNFNGADTLTVLSTDALAATASSTVALTVTAVNDAPSFTLPASALIPAGATWTARDSTRNWTRVASSADGTKLAAAVQSGLIYTSTNSGATWTQGSSGSRVWNGLVSSADGTKLVASALDTFRIYTSTNSGANWTERTSAGNRNWLGLASSADGTKLAAVADSDRILHFDRLGRELDAAGEQPAVEGHRLVVGRDEAGGGG